MKLSDYFASMDRLVQKQEQSVARQTTMLDFLSQSRIKTEKTIQSLDAKLARLTQNRRETIERIKIVEQNIIIYEKNINKINEFTSKIDDDVVDLKHKYNSLFTGSLTDVIGFSEDKSKSDEAKDPKDSTPLDNSPPDDDDDEEEEEEEVMVLMELKKRSLLSSLESVFKKYEEKISDSNHSKEDLLERKGQIEEKLRGAKEDKALFYSVEGSYSLEIASITAKLKEELIKFKSIALFSAEIIKRVHKTSNIKKEARLLLE